MCRVEGLGVRGLISAKVSIWATNIATRLGFSIDSRALSSYTSILGDI